MIINALSNGKELQITSSSGIKIAPFSNDIEKVLLFKDVVLVLVLNNKEYFGRNIFCVLGDGTIAWQVDQPDRFKGIDANRSVSFTDIWVDKEGRIMACSLNDFDYEVDLNTGKFLNKCFKK